MRGAGCQAAGCSPQAPPRSATPPPPDPVAPPPALSSSGHGDRVVRRSGHQVARSESPHPRRPFLTVGDRPSRRTGVRDRAPRGPRAAPIRSATGVPAAAPSNSAESRGRHLEVPAPLHWFVCTCTDSCAPARSRRARARRPGCAVGRPRVTERGVSGHGPRAPRPPFDSQRGTRWRGRCTASCAASPGARTGRRAQVRGSA